MPAAGLRMVLPMPANTVTAAEFPIATGVTKVTLPVLDWVGVTLTGVPFTE